MRNVVFVAPFFLEATVRFLHAAATLPGVRLALLSQDPLDRVPPNVRSRLAAHVRVEDALDPARIVTGLRTLAGEVGTIDRVFGPLEQLQVPLAEARQALGIEGLGVDAARNFRDKSRMKDVLRAAGVPCARHRLIGTAGEATEFAREVGFPIVAKPPAGAGGRETFRLDTETDLARVLATVRPDPARPTLLEEFVRGEEHSFDAIHVHGRPVWHSLSHYYPSPLEVMENSWIQWCVLVPREIDDPRYDDIRSVAARALAALGMGTGLAHMEWFRRPDGTIAVSEVGVRPPGAQFTSLISYAHDIDLYRAWAELMAFDRFEPPARKYAAGAAYLRGQGRGTVRAIHGLDAAQREIGPLVVEVKLPRPGQTPASSYEGEGYVILRHPSTEVVRHALQRLVTLVRVELG